MWRNSSIGPTVLAVQEGHVLPPGGASIPLQGSNKRGCGTRRNVPSPGTPASFAAAHVVAPRAAASPVPGGRREQRALHITSRARGTPPTQHYA